MKKLCGVIVLALLTLTGCSNTTRESLDVRATITAKHEGSGQSGKTHYTTYNLTCEYDKITLEVDNSQLYNVLEVGDRVNASLVTVKNEQNEVVTKYLELK